MFRIAKVGAPDQRIIRKITFLSSGRGGAMLDVMLEYAPPDTLNEQLEREKARVVGAMRYGAPEDLQQTQQAVQTRWHMILASRVHRIEGLTARKLATLLSLDPAALASTAGTLDVDIETDPSDTTPINDEDRKTWDIPDSVKTVGQQASQNIFYLVNACHEFRTFLETVIRDPAYFQDKDWESQIKNSVPGAALSSAAV